VDAVDEASVKLQAVQELYASAVARHQAGELAEAERVYRQVLSAQPDHAEAMNLLGTVVFSLGRRREAVSLIGGAVQLAPDCAEFHFNLANALRQTGQLEQAISGFEAAVKLRPDFVHAVTSLGQALGEAGRTAEAVAAFEKAAALRPDLAEAQNNYGNALCDAGRCEQAFGPLRKAIELNPNLSGAHSNLGNAHFRLGQLEEAVAAYRRAVELEPKGVRYLNNLSVALRGLRQYDESIACCRWALEVEPQSSRSYDNLGSALASKGLLEEAEAAYRRGLNISPSDVEIYCNLGHIFYFKGQWNKAQSVYQAILNQEPDNAQAHWSMALILLTLGEYEKGWSHYEWRWRVKELHMRLRTEAPRWNGSDLGGRKILLHNEQGFGDTIQFVRYIPEVTRRGGKVILACQPELFSLLKDFPGIERCIRNDEPTPPGTVEHHVVCPLLSLPGVLRTTAKNIPADIPYLSADAEKEQFWKERLAGEKRLKIGVAWAGRPGHPNDHNRSLSFSRLAPLMGAADVRWISLQFGAAAGQAANSPIDLTDWTEELKDFSDTAALIANLDLVIAADTAVVHLAGAMGKRAWVLLPFIPDWRWMLKRSDSPWYPTLRLFRQTRIGDWTGPVEQAAEALRGL
jgi:tetratricopeptide (TPR) repeat protein